eukprot:7387715-Prymnesium_polylepis.2
MWRPQSAAGSLTPLHSRRGNTGRPRPPCPTPVQRSRRRPARRSSRRPCVCVCGTRGCAVGDAHAGAWVWADGHIGRRGFGLKHENTPLHSHTPT